MRRINIIFIIMLMGAFALAGCGSPDDTSDSREQTQSSVQEQEQTEEPEATIELNNTYTTKFMDVMAVTYPNFQVSYPGNWTLSDDTVDTENISETFTLTDQEGAQIQFYHLTGDLGMGSRAAAAIVEISKAGDSDFVPGMVQAGDMSDLGSFSVMKIATKEMIRVHDDGSREGEKVDMADNECTYAVLPDSEIGTMECNQPDSAQFSFDYANPISIVATPPNSGAFTDQEMKEVLAILKSFRVEELN